MSQLLWDSMHELPGWIVPAQVSPEFAVKLSASEALTGAGGSASKRCHSRGWQLVLAIGQGALVLLHVTSHPPGLSSLFGIFITRVCSLLVAGL